MQFFSARSEQKEGLNKSIPNPRGPELTGHGPGVSRKCQPFPPKIWGRTGEKGQGEAQPAGKLKG